MRYRLNAADASESVTNLDVFVIFKDRDTESVFRGLKKAGLITRFDQIVTLRPQDCLPAYWPDRYYLDYRPKPDGDIVKALLVRVREE